MDSTGLRVLPDAFTVAGQHGGRVHWTALQGPPARLIEITKLSERFRLHTNTAIALAASLTAPDLPAARGAV
ncbi:STAS domain-containing protein [Nonomuraea sp. NPDC050643]|uniref:STAS domain-containing protein n=1 Tax=Nonomuraea sp. NPDC050643 TaxID=3155660 RepID=UPI0033F69063